jgi:hypothetical protein
MNPSKKNPHPIVGFFFIWILRRLIVNVKPAAAFICNLKIMITSRISFQDVFMAIRTFIYKSAVPILLPRILFLTFGF